MGCHMPLPGLCGEQAQEGGYHRSCGFSSMTDITRKAVPGGCLWCWRLYVNAQEYRPALTCLHWSSQEGQTISLTPAEEMGKTRSGKLRSSGDSVIRCLNGCLIQRAWLFSKGMVSLKESQKKWSSWRNVKGKDTAISLVLRKVDRKHQTSWKKPQLCPKY